MKIYNSIEELVGGTPLLALERYGKDLPAKILAKLEFLNPAGSAKDRIAKEMIAEAEKSGRLAPGGTIIEPTSGNTGIGLAAIAAILVWALGAKGYTDFGVFGIVVGVIFPISMFTYVSCCLLANNFIGGLTLEVFSWGFVTLPGIIFEFSIDGCLGFIALKILFFVISIALMVVAAVAAILIGGVISLFVYPFAITKNFKRPEETRLKGD